MKKCAIIGFGNWGKKISTAVYETKKFDIQYIMDKEYLDKSFHNIKKCDSIDVILNDKNIDTVFIFTPNYIHGCYVKLCAKYKKNIFVEKPICNTVSEAIDVLNECKKNSCKLMVGHNVKYYSIYKKVKELIDSNFIGDIYHIEMNRSRPIWQTITEDSWRFKKENCNGGPLIQMGLHMIDTINYFFNFNSNDLKVIGTNKYLKSENFETYNVIGKLSGDITFYLYSSYLPAETFFINIYGSKGSIFADVNRGLFYQEIDSFKVKNIPYTKNNPELDEINDFYNLISSKDYDYSNVEQAIRNVEEIEKILNV